MRSGSYGCFPADCRRRWAGNCPRAVVEGSLERAGLLAGFHLVVPDARDRLRPEPHPDVYAVAARLCGLPAHRALAVEDSLTGGEVPARRGRSPPRPGAWTRRLRG
ncbi:hypothetical protein [Streptomyces plicatus]|uniref:hypothetical protein n=1 Tax=Streptomyces plicatus TaxID=1922 RepID=UPI0019A0E4EA|nr:hypothetical protein GCM10010301_69240 [Streptomyces plicatus]